MKFKGKWLFNDDLFYLVKEVRSNFIKGSQAYRLTKKIQFLKDAIKFGNNKRKHVWEFYKLNNERTREYSA